MFAKKKKEEFKKKVKLPNKYKNVKKTLNTGMTVNDVIMLSNNQVVKKNSEIFKRITAKKLEYIINNDPLSESVISNNFENENKSNNINLKKTTLSIKNKNSLDFQSKEDFVNNNESLISNNFENKNNYLDSKNNFIYSKNHLLIDLRSKEEFDKFHIKNCFLKSFINSNNEF